MHIGERIKARRNELNWSQRELAEKMGYNHSTITRIEAGSIDIPQSRVVQFSEVLNVSIAYLMGWENEEFKKADAIADVALRMRSDDEFSKIVNKIMELSPEQLKAIDTILSSMN